MRVFYIFAAFVSLSALPAAASPVVIDADGYQTETVRIDYLDLASSSGQAVLNRKLARAVRHVCGISRSTDLGEIVKAARCQRDALVQANLQRDLAVTTAIRKERMALASVGRVASR